ncbi:MAG: hypothetical protein ABIF77_13195 [bacterium]
MRRYQTTICYLWLVMAGWSLAAEHHFSAAVGVMDGMGVDVNLITVNDPDGNIATAGPNGHVTTVLPDLNADGLITTSARYRIQGEPFQLIQIDPGNLATRSFAAAEQAAIPLHTGRLVHLDSRGAADFEVAPEECLVVPARDDSCRVTSVVTIMIVFN